MIILLHSIDVLEFSYEESELLELYHQVGMAYRLFLADIIASADIRYSISVPPLTTDIRYFSTADIRYFTFADIRYLIFIWLNGI